MATYSSVDAVPQRGGSSSGMFTNQIVKFVMLTLGCLFSVFIGQQITSADSNALATLAVYAAAGCFIAALISPRKGIYLVLFMCPVLDLIKRLLILFDSLNMIDVASVLAVAPVTLAGAVLGTLCNRFIFRRQSAMAGEGKLYLILAMFVVLTVVGGVVHNADSKLLLLKNLGENCIYLCLILLIPVYFPETEDVAKLMRWCVVVFVPVALYGFWQDIFGLSDFEYHYLLSGMTITTDDFLGSERVFSTLNSNHSFSVTMACIAVLSLIQRHLPARGGWQTFVKKRALWLFVLFCAATAISLRRTGWLVVGFSVGGAICFRSRFRTTFFYGTCFFLGLWIILNSEYIYANLPNWETSLQTTLPGHDQAFHLQTFNDRLASFQALRDNPAIWTLFGQPIEDRGSIYAHDAISETLLSYGIVGMTAFIAVIVGVLAISHRLVWRAANVSDQAYISLLLAFIFSNLFVGALMQSHINIFPINFVFWLCAGALLKITIHQQPIAVAEPEITLPTMAEATQQQMVVVGRHSATKR